MILLSTDREITGMFPILEVRSDGVDGIVDVFDPLAEKIIAVAQFEPEEFEDNRFADWVANVVRDRLGY